MIKRQKISPDFKMRPKRGYRKTDADGYSDGNTNGFIFEDAEAWMFSKVRKHSRYKNLF